MQTMTGTEKIIIRGMVAVSGRDRRLRHSRGCSRKTGVFLTYGRRPPYLPGGVYPGATGVRGRTRAAAAQPRAIRGCVTLSGNRHSCI